jgi:GT2 family glycosyltransferase
MKLSVVIINYKTPKQLLECIASVKATAPEVDDIVVIDNRSEDESVDLLRKTYPEVRVVASSLNGGFAMAANWGINLARYETVLLLNPDIIVEKDAIQNLYKKLHSEKSIAIAAPKLLNFDKTLQFSVSRFHRFFTPLFRRTFFGKTSFGKKELDRFEMKSWNHENFQDIDWAIGAALMMKRDIVTSVGLMDSRFFLYFEDVDLCRRVWEAGYRVVYVPSSVMLHEHKRLSAYQSGLKSVMNKVTRIHIHSWIQYYLKNKGKLKVDKGTPRGNTNSGPSNATSL